MKSMTSVASSALQEPGTGLSFILKSEVKRAVLLAGSFSNHIFALVASTFFAYLIVPIFTPVW
jgi:hypothetical protein